MSRHYKTFTVTEKITVFSVQFKHSTKNKKIRMSFPKKGMNEFTPDKQHTKAEVTNVAKAIATILDSAF